MSNEFKWVIKTLDGDSYTLSQKDVRRTLDRRGEWEKPQVVFELTIDGLVRRIWPEDIVYLDQLPL